MHRYPCTRLEIVCTQKVPGVRISPSPPLEVISSAAKHLKCLVALLFCPFQGLFSCCRMPLSEVDSRDFFGATIGATIYYTHGVAPMPLTDTRIKAAKPTDKVYKIYDAEGLYIEVPLTGSKRWRFKYRINGKEKRISLGIYPEIGLKDARENVMKLESRLRRAGTPAS